MIFGFLEYLGFTGLLSCHLLGVPSISKKQFSKVKISKYNTKISKNNPINIWQGTQYSVIDVNYTITLFVEFHDLCLSDKMLVVLWRGKRRNITLSKIILWANVDIFIVQNHIRQAEILKGNFHVIQMCSCILMFIELLHWINLYSFFPEDKT